MPWGSESAAVYAGRNGGAWLQGREGSDRALSECCACAGALRRDPAAISGGRREKLSTAGTVQLLRRARRNHAGL